MAELFPFEIKFQSGPAGDVEPVTFDSMPSAVAWLREEVSYWSWVPDVGGAVGTHYRDNLHRVAADLDASSVPDSTATNKLQGLRSFYSNGRLIPSASDFAEFVTGLRTSHSDYVAAGALRTYMQLKPSERINDKLGEFLALSRELSFTPEMATQARAELDDLRQEWGNELSNMNHSREEADTRLAQVIADIGDTQNAYEERLKLKAPVTYWTDRRKSAALWAGIFAAVAVATLAGALVYAGWLSKEIWDTKAAPHHIALIIGAFTLVIYALRVLVKLANSQFHLALGAREREVMAETYLALVNDGKVPNPEEQTLMLTALFKHDNTGLVAGGSDLPPGIYDTLLKLLKK